MSVLFCDTDCELWYTTAKELGVKVIGMPYTVDGEEKMYDLGENTDFKDFYSKMRAGSSVSTAGLNKEIYLDIFRPYFEAGEDILYVAFSSKMSNTFEPLAAAIAELESQFPKARYRKFDTLNICLGAGILVYLAAKFFAAHDGDIDATYDYLSDIVGKVKVNFVVGDLRYLARGGRLSPSKARMGNVLQAKPVLHVDKEGEISVLTKVIGAKKAMSYVVDEFAAHYRNVDDAPVFIVGADCDDLVAELKDRVAAIAPDADLRVQPVGPVIGAHCGPGTYGIIYMSDER